MIPGYQGTEIKILILTPKDLQMPAPCLINIHGGGFVFEGSNSHYRPAMIYAKEVHCEVIYVRYRLSVEFHETKGTMHGFDTVFNAPTSQAMIAKRVTYMKHMYYR